MTVEHKTERGALLAALEHRCLRPGKWLVEGWTVERYKASGGTWRVWRTGELTELRLAPRYVTFTDALRWIAAGISVVELTPYSTNNPSDCVSDRLM